MMKRIFEVAIVGAALLTLAGCSSSGAGDASGDEQHLTEGTPAAQEQGAVGDLQGAERKELLDTVRQEFYKRVERTSPPVEFVVKSLKVTVRNDIGFAFLEATPVKAGTVDDYDYTGTPIQRFIDDAVFGGNVLVAVIRNDGAKWDGIEMLAIGPTDAPWAGLNCRRGVPAEILPGASDEDCN